MQRSRILTAIAEIVCVGATRLYHNVELHNLERLPREGYVLLPKHHSFRDGFVEAYAVHRGSGKVPYFLIKAELPGILQLIGGLPVARHKDVCSAVVDEEEKHEMNVLAYRQVTELLSRGEVIVTHPETTRYYKTKGVINPNAILKLLDVQKALGQQISFVPMDIEYKETYWMQPCSTIVATVGEPILVADDGLDALVEHLQRNIVLL